MSKTQSATSCTQLREEAIIEGLEQFVAVYQMELTAPRLTAYVAALKGFSVEQIEEAFAGALRTMKWLPKPAEVHAFAQEAVKAQEASIDSMHCANQRFRSRASRLLSELEDAIAAGETDVAAKATEVYEYAVKAHEGSLKTEAFRHSIAGASALKAAEALLLKVTAAYEAATGAAK